MYILHELLHRTSITLKNIKSIARWQIRKNHNFRICPTKCVTCPRARSPMSPRDVSHVPPACPPQKWRFSQRHQEPIKSIKKQQEATRTTRSNIKQQGATRRSRSNKKHEEKQQEATKSNKKQQQATRNSVQS